MNNFLGISHKGQIDRIASREVISGFNRNDYSVIITDYLSLALKKSNQVYFSSESSYVCFVQGEVYNLIEVIEELGWIHNSEDKSFAFWVVFALQNGVLSSFLAKIDGFFSCVLLDSESDKIRLISDRNGLKFIFWSLNNGLFSFSDNVHSLLNFKSQSRSINKPMYSCFIDLGYLVGEHTWFSNVKLLGPSTILTYNLKTSNYSTELYWKWSDSKPHSLSFNDAVDAMYESFKDSLQKRFNPIDKVGISLSGGLDSRAILAGVDTLFPDYKGMAFTFGLPNCGDLRIAKQVSKVANWSHKSFYYNDINWLFPRIERVFQTDGMLDIRHMHGSEFMPKLKSEIDYNLNGYLGDVVLGGGWINGDILNKRTSNENLKDFYKEYSIFEDWKNPYYEIRNREVGLYTNRARRFTNLGVWNFSSFINQKLPFFDNKILEMAMNLPDEYRYENRLYREMLLRYFPKYFLKIPWQKTGRSIQYSSKITNDPISQMGIKLKRKFYREEYSYANYQAWVKTEFFQNFLNNLFFKQKYLSPDYFHDAKTFNDLNEVNRKISTQELFRIVTVEIYLKSLNKQGLL